MRLYRCDRCHDEATYPAGWKTVSTNALPHYQGGVGLQSALNAQIIGHVHPSGTELCASCVGALTAFLAPLPKEAE